MKFEGKTFWHLSPLAAVGGCEINALRLIEALPSHKHIVLVFDLQGPLSEKWIKAGAQVFHLESWSQGLKAFKVKLTDWVSTQATPNGIFYWSTSRLHTVLDVVSATKAPLVVHAGNPVDGGAVSRLRRILAERINGRNSNVTVVSCSKYVSEGFEKAFYFRRFRNEVIYNPVASVPERKNYRELPPGSKPRIGMVARLDRIKDHRTLIRAMAIACKSRQDITLELAGDGELRRVLEDETRRLGIDSMVKFYGFTSVEPLMREWDLYAHSTTQLEGMGTAVAEAMMAGLPCVVSDIRVMREVCGNDCAFYARVADPADWAERLLKLLSDQSLREASGRALRARAQSLFAMPEVAARYLSVLESQTWEASP